MHLALVEVLDISARLRAHSIPGIPNPQGVVYAPDAKKLFVASSKGKLRIFDGSNFDLIREIGFHGDVDKFAVRLSHASRVRRIR